MQGLLSSLTDKAQSALKSTSLGRSSSADGSSSNQSSSSGGILKSHAFESFHHQLRSFQQQYSSSVTPVQKIITTQKGIALDFDNVSRDAHAHSKELYMWGQSENEDLKDVTDRLAWMAYIEGSLAANLAKEIDASRAAFKALRDAENGLSGRRNIRATLENQIARIEHDQRHGMDQKLAELKRQLLKAEEDDESLEKEVELLKRKAIKESEAMKWNAIREYAEKLALVSQAAAAALPALPDVPSSKLQPYTGAQSTASIRATLQQALDHWQVGDSTLLLREPTAADLNRSDTRSFGVTHAQELARINTADPTKTSIPITPPPTHDHPPQAPSHNANGPPPSAVSAPAVSPVTTAVTSSTTNKASSPPAGTASPPLNPAVLNQAPAPIPPQAGSPTPVIAPDPSEPTVKIPTVTPTVAETGVPKTAGPDGPGPATGSLKDIKHPSPVNTFAPTVAAGGAAANFESAEDEKKRLEREDRERLLRAGGSAPPPVGEQPKFESAEEEKKRLEREDREQLLATGGSSRPDPDSKQDDTELPPYQEF
ncbi:Eisosome component PIL1-domain-containing protein [Daedaleopsis nitida]|nr:Eisosome component PIL1-domain-containing protein [Daedaleopsis nitida]